MLPSVVPLLNAVPVEECSICRELVDSFEYRTECGHIYHRNCISQWYTYNRTCPQCRQIISAPDTSMSVLMRSLIGIICCAVISISSVDIFMTNAFITIPLSGLHILVYIKLLIASLVFRNNLYKKSIIIFCFVQAILIMYSISLIIQYDVFQTYNFTSKTVVWYDICSLFIFIIVDIARTAFNATREFLTL
jgi:hypothetical protein